MTKAVNTSFLISSMSDSGAKTIRKTYEKMGFIFIAAERDGNTVVQEFKPKEWGRYEDYKSWTSD